ncbi:RNA-dependent RNA polymerase [Brome mosaic virus]|uniref:RNA-directed RNA polymerase 2a n=2 Tax=Brome mosaic virus TaxID=12302 RepID=RDRP_BMV|nr:RNA-dependent RNA polymerase [Brome mosaic virus]P03594.1 RecName: Full=RNA-directed RNA polymerase 2a; Short=protein 2a [Brome mosaic virus]CAA25834.1 unnamed protein product [Brome mosaic virus]
MSSKTWDDDFVRQVPSFQWIIDQSLEDEVEAASLQVQEPADGVAIDGSLASFKLAIAPLEIGGVFDPPFDRVRWGSICDTVQQMVQQFTDRPLIPQAEMARMLYLDIPGSFVLEDEIDDWYPEDTSDGYGVSFAADEDHASDLKLASDSSNCEIEEVRVTGDTPKELTLGDRYMGIDEEFQTTNTDYDITLQIMNPIEHRVSRVIDTHCHPDNPDISTGPIYMERVSLARTEATSHSILPTHAYFDDSYHQALVENGDYSMDFDRIRLKQSDVDWYRDPDKYFQPKMNIGSAQRRVGTQKEVLTALKKRNADVPEMGDAINMKDTAKAIAKRFRSTFLNVDGEDCLRASMDVMTKCLEYHKKWGKHMDLQGVNVAAETDLCRYQHMLKSDVKPVVTDTLHLERAVAATITFHSKGVTSNFSPFFTACFEKLSLALKSRFIVPIGKISSLELKNVRLNNRYFLEADLSKFDKSQGELHLEFQREILLALGFPAPLTNWWSDFHRDSYLSDPHAKVGMSVSFQRRTGDAFTYFGNTLVTMAMIAYASDLSDCDCAIFSGDDSLIISKVKPVLDTDMFTSLFNMEIKVMDPSVPYVCSKFLVETEMGNLVSVPDPLREIQRLAKRKILRDEQMLRAHFVSFCDRMKFINQLDEKMITTLCHFVYLKYGKEKPWIFEEVRAALAAFSLYSENFLRFSDCYCTEGIRVYQMSDPVCKFKRTTEERKTDGDWFHNWKNPKFPGVLDKVYRTIGIYSSDCSTKELPVKRIGRLHEALERESLKLANDRRTTQRLKKKVDDYATGRGGLTSVDALLVKSHCETFKPSDLR